METTSQKRHHAACSNRDYDFFYEGLEDQKLLVQQCERCSALRHPPEPMCPECHCTDWSAKELTGKGRIYSYALHYHPPLPGFDMPHPVGVVALDEGVRIVAGLEGVPVAEIAIDMPVKAEFFRRGDMATVRFART